ncbi:hypothetical protein J4409_00560 [Candidatus Woesearchaeota archaeon]|nr:hypothetical protein [Candidatus Woesearchaeota archaeon]
MHDINIKQLDNVTKILLILLIGVVLYFAIFLMLKPFFITQQTSRMGMMSQMFGYSSASTTTNLIALIVAIAIAVVASFYLFRQEHKETASNITKEQEYSIIKKALSEDERLIMEEIKKAGEITQDSLRFRLNWSKAKTSTILNNLDRVRLIQKERTGKTYKVFLQKRD